MNLEGMAIRCPAAKPHGWASLKQSLPALIYIAVNSTQGRYAENELLRDILSGAEQFDLPKGHMRYLRCHFKGD